MKEKESIIAKIFRVGGNIIGAIFAFLIISLLIGMFFGGKDNKK